MKATVSLIHFLNTNEQTKKKPQQNIEKVSFSFLNSMHNKGIKTLKLKYFFYCQALNYRHFYRDRGGRHE